ncbi:MAG TPA: hypothetical protein VIC04_10510 [Terriglobia bacterium]
MAFFLLVPALAQAQGFAWVRRFGTGRDEQVNAVGVSSSGVYIGGNTIGVLPGQTSAGLNDLDAFVARYDTAGNELWLRQFGSSTVAQDSVQGVAADSTGVYVVGRTDGTLPGKSSSGGTDVFVRKYDVNGTEQWTQQFGTSTDDQATAAAVDPTGLYVAGILGVGGSRDAFVRKYDLSGSELWTRQFGTVDGDEARGVAVDASGVYVSGYTGGALAPTPQGGADVFVRKYDASGTVVWTTQFGTATTDVLYGNAVAVNASGVYVVGETAGTFAGQTKAGGLFDAFVAKFDLAGSQQWVRQFGTDADDYGYGVAVNSIGVYVVGGVGGALPGQTGIGGSDVYVRRYDVNGAETGTSQFGSPSHDEAYGIAADSTGVYIGGYSSGAGLGGTPLGGSDAFVLRIPPPPDILVGGIVNAASFAQHPAPLGPGTIATIFGTNLNDGSTALNTSFGSDGLLITSLGGSQVRVNGVLAPMFFSTPGQLAIQIPNEVAGQTTANVTVTASGQTSVIRSIFVEAVSPGVFTANQSGSGPGAITHVNGSAVTQQNPARPGEILVLYATGFGVLSPPLATGAPSAGNTTAAPATLTVDGAAATVLFSGSTPGLVGLNQINFTVPASTRTANNIPVVVTIGGKQANTVTIAVAP